MAVFVITGARRGIGLEYVRQLSASQNNTIFALIRDVNADNSALQDIKSHAQGKVHIVGCDITSDESVTPLGGDVSSLLEPGTQIDVIINNAAILNCKDETGVTIPTDRLLNHVNSNVGGPVRVVQSLLPYLKKNGVVANISSGIGSMGMLTTGRITPGIPSYSISKAALNMLSVHQAHSLKERAIVVSIDPGHVKTTMGGPNAVMEITDSARQVLATIGGLKPEDTGKYLLYDGSTLPW